MRLHASEKHAVTFHVKHALSVTCVGDSETGSGSFAYSPPPPLGAPPLAPSPPPPPPLLPPLRAAGLSLLAAGASHPMSLPQTLHHHYPLFLPFPFPHLVWCFRLDRLERVSMLLALLLAWLPRPCLALSRCERADGRARHKLPCQKSSEKSPEGARQSPQSHARTCPSQIAVTKVAMTSLRSTHSIHTVRARSRGHIVRSWRWRRTGGGGRSGGGSQAHHTESHTSTTLLVSFRLQLVLARNLLCNEPKEQALTLNGIHVKEFGCLIYITCLQ
jgi:hypothetical protein